MEIYEYLYLSDEDQWDELFDNGKHLTDYKSIDCSFSLYALHKFFIEVEFDPLYGNSIGKHVFVHGARIDKYIGEYEI